MNQSYLVTINANFKIILKNGATLILGGASHFEVDFNHSEIIFKNNNGKNIALFLKEDITSICKI